VLRYAVALALPAWHRWPVGTGAVNVIGAFALAFFLARRPSPLLRMGVGTGLLGGFTTYSSFALELDRLLVDGLWPTAVGYAAATLLVGTGAAVLGRWLGERSARATAHPSIECGDAPPPSVECGDAPPPSVECDPPPSVECGAAGGSAVYRDHGPAQ